MFKKKDDNKNKELSQFSPTGKENKFQINDLLTTYGGSGTDISSGYIQEEYNTKLIGQTGLEVYEKMRKSDSQVFATLLAIELPIRGTTWYIEPAKNDDGEVENEAYEIAEFVEQLMFEKMEQSRDDLLREILTMLPFGFSLFEKVFKLEDNKIRIKKLAFRKQDTIERWETLDGTPGITQLLPTILIDGKYKGDNYANIPSEKIVLFSFRKEGDNYEGVSILRSAYKNWFIKDKLIVFDSIRQERGSGFPVITLPNGALQNDIDKAMDIVKNIRTTQQTGIVLPGADWKFEFANVQSGGNTNLYEGIAYHNREIAKNVLAHFIELGSTNSGSRALSEDQSDLFLLSLEAVAKQVEDTINKFVIKELVDYNFKTELYPRLTHKKLGSVGYDKLGNVISTLIGAGAIVPDKDLEAFVRQELDLPPALEEEVIEDEDEMQSEGEVVEQGDDEEINKLENELSQLEASENDIEYSEVLGQLFSEMEYKLESLEFRKPLTEEHKKKISEALKKKGGQDLKNEKTRLKTGIGNTKNEISKVKDQFDKEIGSIRDEIKGLTTIKQNIAKGKATKEQRQKLKDSIKSLRDRINQLKGEKTSKLEPLKKIKTAAIEGKKQVNQIIRDRKKAITAQVKSIRLDIKSGSMQVKEGVSKLNDLIKSNIEQKKSIRAEMKGLKRGDPRREALSALIDGLNNENDGLRNEKSSIKEAGKEVKEKKKEEITKIKDESGLYDEADIISGKYFQDLSNLIDKKFIIKIQNNNGE